MTDRHAVRTFLKDPEGSKLVSDMFRDMCAEEDPAGSPDSYDFNGVIPKHLISKGPIPECIKNCKICRGQFKALAAQQSLIARAYDGYCTDEEAANIITNHITDTTTKLAYVRTILDNHGDVIKKRFEKRSPQKRAELLRMAMPGMYPSKWLAMYYVFDEFIDPGVAATQYRHLERVCRRKCWLLPYLNVDILSNDPSKLLVLLHIRSTHSIEDFLPYDIERTSMAFEDQHVKTKYNPHCVVMCSQAGIMGNLTDYDSAAAHRGDITGFPRAQLAFEAANELATFLRRFVDAILSTGPPDQPQGCLKLDFTVDESLRVSSKDRSSYNERAFSRPSPRNLTYFKDIMQSMFKSTYDDLWLLQTDPVYFRQQLAIIEATGFHRGLDPKEKARNVMWCVREAVGRVQLAMQIETTVAICFDRIDASGSQVWRGDPLPKLYNDALALLQSVTTGYYRSYNRSLMSLLARTPTFEEHFRWVDGKHAPINQLNANVSKPKDILYWNFLQIAMPPQVAPLLLERSFHLHYIDDLLQSPKERTRVDQTLYDRYSCMLAIDEAENVLASHLPRSSGERWPNAENVGLPDAFGNLEEPTESSLLKLLDKFMRAPVPTGKPTSQNLSRIQEMHTAATEFWNSFAPTWAEHSVHPAAIERHIFAYRSEEYQSEYRRECARMQAAIDQKALNTQVRPAAAGLQPETWNVVQNVWGNETSPTGSSPQRKRKVKTRSEAIEDPTSQLADMQLEGFGEAVAQEPIPVGRDSKTVFTRMFSPSVEIKGLLKWDQITAALVDSGLSMVPNGGSRVTFTHSDPQKGSIVFHRPHPDPSVGVVMLRCMAKRLSKWFGWEAGTFV
ncbi:hypothetical protein LTR10_004199 [Elasticomyces elasticus]|nr:hypothetical protein LTR10_004199 [Elasticomyces elasticus]KAK4977618.1 hypothetical protein LTR42_001989 [Elasticomyces elasticus]